MTTKDIIKQIMDNSNVTYVELAQKVGESRQTVWGWLNSRKGDIETSRMIRLLNALEHRVMIIPDDVKKPTGAIEITGG